MIGSSLTHRAARRFAFAAFVATQALAVDATPPTGYRLVWADEFDGTALDTTRWAYRADTKHRSIQQRENVSLRDGLLRLDLRVLAEPISGMKAAGAGIVSRQKFRYGYFEVRARLGRGEGLERGWHHSFWAMAAEIDAAGNVGTTYPALRRTEIDCFENSTEHRFDPAEETLAAFTQHVIVWGANGRETARLPVPPADHTRLASFDGAAWHTYAFQWTPDTVTFYVDGRPTHVADYPAARYTHDEVNLWLTAISANWNLDGQIPSRAEYDYIRIYEAADPKLRSR